jgi:hypothetical protein
MEGEVNSAILTPVGLLVATQYYPDDKLLNITEIVLNITFPLT